jgi:ribonuclease HI
MNKHTGKEAWASVVNYKGDDIIPTFSYLFADMKLKEVNLPVGKRMIIISSFNDVKKQQNNGAELLAMVAALRIASSGVPFGTSLESYKIEQICSDSQLITEYWSKHEKYADKCLDISKANYIRECVKLRSEFTLKGGKIVKISGSENPADLGYHR